MTTHPRDDERVPLHSTGWGMHYAVFAVGFAIACLILPFHVVGALFSRNFGEAAALSAMVVTAGFSVRAILRHDNTVWMTRNGIEFGNGPTRIAWRHVVDATPWLYGAPGFHTLSFNDGTPDLEFFGSADTNERLQGGKARWQAKAP